MFTPFYLRWHPRLPERERDFLHDFDFEREPDFFEWEREPDRFFECEREPQCERERERPASTNSVTISWTIVVEKSGKENAREGKLNERAEYPGLGPDLITSRTYELPFVPIGSWQLVLLA
jgi:hypothetical protein